MTYSELNRILKDNLSPHYPDREISSIGRLVLEHLTGLDWVQIRLNQDSELLADQESDFKDILARLKNHEPVQYVLGETEFYGLKLKVRHGVLIPRGETEELVEWALSEVEQEGKAEGRKAEGQNGRTEGIRAEGQEGKSVRMEVEKGIRVLDIGCGSGAIAIALAKHLPGAEVVASDISGEALTLTMENAELNNVKVRIAALDILSPQRLVIPAQTGTPSTLMNTEGSTFLPFDLILSNPPYIPASGKSDMDLHVIDHEPELALFVPDDDPLIFYRAIADFAVSFLNPGGQVFVEIHDRLGAETVGIFKKSFSNVELRKDIHGKDRMIRAYHG